MDSTDNSKDRGKSSGDIVCHCVNFRRQTDRIEWTFVDIFKWNIPFSLLSIFLLFLSFFFFYPIDREQGFIFVHLREGYYIRRSFSSFEAIPFFNPTTVIDGATIKWFLYLVTDLPLTCFLLSLWKIGIDLYEKFLRFESKFIRI